MAEVEMTSIRVMLNEFHSRTGQEGKPFDEPLILRFAEQGMERMSVADIHTHTVALIPIRNYIGQLPKYFRAVTQAAYRIKPTIPCDIERVSKMTEKIFGTGCELEISVKCAECQKHECVCDEKRIIEVDANRIWQTAHPENYTKYMSHFFYHGGLTKRGEVKSMFDQRFKLMRRTSNTFFNVPYHLDGCLNLNLDCNIEYNIDPPNIITNFKEGEVLLSCTTVKRADDGYRLIPNEPVVFEALVYYIRECLASARYDMTHSSEDRRYWQDMMVMREKYIARARSQLRTPSADKWWQFLKNHWMKVVPYHNWEQNLNRGTPDAFQFPDQTTNPRGYLAPYYSHQL